MFKTYLYQHLKQLKLSKNYFYLSLIYGFSTLLIPFGVQLLVNNLALTGLWVNTLSFLLLIGLGLLISILIKYAQFIIVEYMQRHILSNELGSWFEDTNADQFKSPYYFEMFKLLKTFASLCTEGMDFVLTLVFGILAIAFIHPAFLLISILFCVSLGIIRLLGRGAIGTSINESTKKYDLFYSLDTKNLNTYDGLALNYFQARDHHFCIIKRQAMVVYSSYFILQIGLLTWGIHLIQIDSLSIGQLVSAEIIASNIFMNLVKLPKLLEGFYDFETSCYKIDYAKVGGVK